MTIANSITLIRILVGPLFLLLYLYHDFFHISFFALPYVLILLVTLSELSDGLDGYFARKYGEVTELGKVLDPMADSIYRISIFLTFTLPPVKLPLLLVFIFLYRDSIISTLRTICALRGFALGARLSGKLKAIVQGTAVFLILFLFAAYTNNMISEKFFQNLSFWITGTAAVYTLLSGFEYIYTHRVLIKNSLYK